MKKYIILIICTLLIAMIVAPTALAAPEWQGGQTVHTVGQGETLSDIAAYYGVTVDSILRQNGVANADMIYAGQKLVIPTSSYHAPADKSGCQAYHTVRTGETLFSISWRYNTSVDALMSGNDLMSKNLVFVGQELCIPYPGYVPPAPSSTSYTHTVVQGETLSAIAQRYGVSYIELMQLNGLANPSLIRPGQKLMIPGYHSSDAPTRDQTVPPPPAYKGKDVTYSEPVKAPSPPKYKSVVVIEDDGVVPPAPAYDPNASTSPRLPVAAHPIEVSINGQESWGPVGYPTVIDDPDGITTLVVNTGEVLGAVVRVRGGDIEARKGSEFSGEFGPFAFAYRYIPPGVYDVWIDDPDAPSVKAKVEIGAGERAILDFSKKDGSLVAMGADRAAPDGWYLAYWENESKRNQNLGGWSSIMVQTPASGMSVVIESEGGYWSECFTGSKGDGLCEFAALGAGFYYIHIANTQLTVKMYMDGNARAQLVFGHQAVPDSDEIVIE